MCLLKKQGARSNTRCYSLIPSSPLKFQSIRFTIFDSRISIGLLVQLNLNSTILRSSFRSLVITNWFSVTITF